MGLKVLLFNLNLDTMALMACNPAVGGLAKGHLVKEIDALGGVMGNLADLTGIQFRTLNLSKGPAVRGTRIQCDKQAYRLAMKSLPGTRAAASTCGRPWWSGSWWRTAGWWGWWKPWG